MAIEHAYGLNDRTGRPLPPSPYLSCDCCWERIDGGVGLVLHFCRDGAKAGPAFAHRGDCASRLEMEHGKAVRQDLSVYLRVLLTNAGFVGRSKPPAAGDETKPELRLPDVRTHNASPVSQPAASSPATAN